MITDLLQQYAYVDRCVEACRRVERLSQQRIDFSRRTLDGVGRLLERGQLAVVSRQIAQQSLRRS